MKFYFSVFGVAMMVLGMILLFILSFQPVPPHTPAILANWAVYGEHPRLAMVGLGSMFGGIILFGYCLYKDN